MKMYRIVAILMIVTGHLAIAQKSSSDIKMDAYIKNLMGKMTLEEKIGQMNLSSGGGGIATARSGIDSLLINGLVGAIPGFELQSIRRNQEMAVTKSRLHIPLLFGLDVIHGYKTIFPIPLGLSCTWDLELIEKSTRIAATEASANGICWTYSPMVDIARDPRWGRIAEGSGEDPWLASRIAAALVKGYQGDDLSRNNTIMACVKHFGLYGGAEAGRDYNTVDMSRLTMYNYYLPPYKAAFDAGAGSAMSSFNVVEYVPATGNHWLLTDLLRTEWGFKGFVVADYDALGQMTPHGMGDLQAVSALALKAGLDMDMASNGFIGTLKKSLTEGKVSQKDIDLACRRILEAKYKLGLFEDPYRYMSEDRAKNEVYTEENLRVEREIAKRSLVLLKNEKQVLPLKKSGTIAVIGPLANSKREMIGTWAFLGETNKAVTVLEGIKNAVGTGTRIVYAKGSNATDDPMLAKQTGFSFGPRKEESFSTSEPLIKQAVDSAIQADAIVAVLGELESWSGEAASRSDIGLPESQRSLLKALLATGKPVVLVLVNGRPLTLQWEDATVPAILEAWNPGSQGGNAVADVLFGDYNPAGKLTASFPRTVGQIPVYYNHLNTGRPEDPKNKFTSKYLDLPNDPLYPFGYGLSYTSFSLGEIRLSKQALKGNETLTVSVTLTNTGKYAGEEVVQLYINDPVASISRPVKELKNFKKVMLQPGESKDVELNVTTNDLKFYNSNLKYDWEAGDFNLYIGTNSRDVKSARISWIK
jgi:beta-glucosidase